MSTNDSDTIVRLAGLAAERGVATLEAPVTGGVHQAARGEITVIVGGDSRRLRQASTSPRSDGLADLPRRARSARLR